MEKGIKKNLPDRKELPNDLIPAVPELTKTEVVVLKYLLIGFDPQDIANEIFVSLRTIRNHIANVHIKLKVNSTAAMIAGIYRNYLFKDGFNYNRKSYQFGFLSFHKERSGADSQDQPNNA